MTNEQVKYMVDRFLAWKLPENFSPDGGISFKKNFNEGTPHPMKHEPSGTNLFDATQADGMVRHMTDGMPGTYDNIKSDLIKMLDDIAPAIEALACHQQQLDMEGVIVGVSRQAVHEVVEAVNAMACILSPATSAELGRDGQ